RGLPEGARSSLLRAVDWQRRALDKAPQMSQYRRWLAGHYSFLAMLECHSGRPDAAVDALTRRLELWPDDANELYGAARHCGLTAAAVKGEAAPRRRCADLALDALRRAVKAGFRDPERARTDPAFRLLRERQDFRDLLTAMSNGPGGPRAGRDADP